MLIFTYNLIFLVLTPIFITRIFFKAIGDSSYIRNLNNRFGFLSTSMEPGIESIWFHSVSLGEVISSSDLVRKLSKDHKVILTTTTGTGFKKANQRCCRRFEDHRSGSTSINSEKVGFGTQN